LEAHLSIAKAQKLEKDEELRWAYRQMVKIQVEINQGDARR